MIVNEEFKHQEQIDLLLAKQIKYGKRLRRHCQYFYNPFSSDINRDIKYSQSVC